MADLVYKVLIILSNFAEAVLITGFFIRFFGFRAVRQYTAVKKAGITAVIFGILEIGILYRFGDLAITLLLFLVLFWFCRRFLGGSAVQHALMILIILLLIPLINGTFLQIILMVSGMPIEEYINIHNPFYLLGIAGVWFICFVVLELLLRFGKAARIYLNKKYGVIYSLILIYSILLEGVLFYSMRSHTQGTAYSLGLFVVSCGAVGINVFIVFTIYKISEKQQQEEVMKRLQLQNTCQEQQIREAKAAENRLRRFKHDYRNMIWNVKELLRKQQVSEALDYLDQVEGYYLKESKEYMDTGNPVLNTALNAKLTVCGEEQIEAYSLIAGQFGGMDGFRIAVLLNNLLDNAIEAERKEKQKKIYVELVIKGEYVSCIVKNAVEESVLETNRELVTTKENRKEHGIGTGHVRELAEDLDGIIDFYEEDGFFCVHCMIPARRLWVRNKSEK